jgi:hypothetical protein
VLKLYLQCCIDHSFKSGLLKESLELWRYVHGPAEFGSCLDGVVEPMVRGGRFRETIVVSINPSLKGSQLYPCSGNEVITRSIEQLRPICNTSMQRSQVDEVNGSGTRLLRCQGVRACQAQQCSLGQRTCQAQARPPLFERWDRR